MKTLTSSTVGSTGIASEHVLRFDRFTLDLRRHRLRRDHAELKLRPKSFDVLRYLAENCGRVVTKDEMTRAVWPQVVVTDDSLVQCIRDVRSVLGDEGQRFIRTVPRRGYMFVATVEAEALDSVERPTHAVRANSAAPLPDVVDPVSEASDTAPGASANPPSRSGPVIEWRGIILRSLPSRALAWGIAIAAAAAISAWILERQAAPSAERLTIAVLPFASLGASNDSHFSDGLSEDIITAVSRFRDVTVIARNSSFRYRDVDVGRAGRELGAAFVLRGSVGRDQDRVRVNVQLVDTRSGATRWAGRYDRPLRSLFELQDDVADHVVSKSVGHARKLAAERIRSRGPNTLEAYELVLRARQEFMTYGRQGTFDAHALLQQSTALDRDYAPAWALLARVYLRFYLHPLDARHLSPQALAQARDAALKAVALDPEFSQAHAALGYSQLWQHQYDEGLESLRHAIALNPNDADTYFFYGDALGRAGEHRTAIEALERARKWDPYSPPIVLGVMARAHIMLGEYEKALSLSRACADRAPDLAACLVARAIAAARTGQSDEARAALQRLLRIDPNASIRRWPRRFKLDSDEAVYAEHLRAAGVPEGPV